MTNSGLKRKGLYYKHQPFIKIRAIW